MKRRIALLLVLALTLSCALVLTSCGGKIEDNAFEGYYNTKYENDSDVALVKTQEAYSFNASATFRQNGNIIYIEIPSAQPGEKQFIAVNADTGAEVYSLTKPQVSADNKTTTNAEVTSYYGNSFIVETVKTEVDTVNNTYTKNIFSAKGEKITSITRPSSFSLSSCVQYLNNDLVAVDGKVYSIEDDVATYKFDLGLVNIPECEASTAEYNYDINSSAVTVYDAKYNFVTRYEKPADIDYMSAFVLANGNLLIQLQDELDSNAKDYDVRSSQINDETGEYPKYSLKTVIYDIANGKEKEIKFEYVIVQVINAAYDDEIFVAEKVENAIGMYPIVDKVVDYTDDIWAVVDSEKLKVQTGLGNEIPDQSGLARLVADNRFVVTNNSGVSYLINEKAEIIGEINSGLIREEDGSVFAIKDDKYYGIADLKLITDTKANDYTNIGGNVYADAYETGETDPVTQLKKTAIDYYVFYNGQYTKLANINKDATVIANSKYIKVEWTVEGTNGAADAEYVAYYNIKGEEIVTVQTNLITDATGATISYVYVNSAVIDESTSSESEDLVIEVRKVYTPVDGTPSTTYQYYIAH